MTIWHCGIKNRQIQFGQRLLKVPEWTRLNTFGIRENRYVEKGYLLSYDRRAEHIAAAPAPHIAELCSGNSFPTPRRRDSL